MEATFRLATGQDLDLICGMGYRTFYDSFAADNRPEDIQSYLEKAFSASQIGSELDDDRSVFMICEVAGSSVGYIKLSPRRVSPFVTGPNPVELVRIYVEREYIGQGIGKASMQETLEQARARGYQTIWLGVWELNQRAIDFYRKWGFEQVGTQQFVLGDDVQTDLVMELKFDPAQLKTECP